ncbi:hypothetical protein DITRI_Ditri09bG0035500 [Diplodiscus trichospermus]
MKLSGQLPQSFEYCQSLQTLDLSANQLSGTIPPQICSWFPYLVTLDLSSNDLSGSIPHDLSKCVYLNNLILSNNRLSGPIPKQLSELARLKKFSVANNDLAGAIPSSFENHDKADFSGNGGLCGGPLGKCGGSSKKDLAIIVAAGVSGAAASILLGLGVWWWYHLQWVRRRKKRYIGTGDDSRWAERLKAHKLTQVSLFQKKLMKVKLADLTAATNNFAAENIIMSTRTGTTYKAVLPDGSAIAIKRLTIAIKKLTTCTLGDMQFRWEMNRLGLLRHPNLAPLLGFYVVEEEKLLPPILQQNICSSVILVDEDFDARIMDFGLARLMTSPDANETSFVNGNGHLGEYGYIAPEYWSTMVASLKGDVYGFGVVLLELVTRQKPLEVDAGEEGFKGNLVDWVNHLSNSGRIKDAIDKSICGRGNDEEILQFVDIACNCVVTRPKDRWSMYQVYQSMKSMAEENGFSERVR